MSGLAPSLLLAPSETLPPSSSDVATITAGSSGGRRVTTDPAYLLLEDVIYADAPGGGRQAFYGATLTRREYADRRYGRLAHTMRAHSEQIERRATPDGSCDHAGLCATTTTRDDKYDEEALLMLLARY